MSIAPKYTVIFVLGGPGAGKGTQCKMLADAYPLHHLSIGDIMRAETETPLSPYAELIRANILEGKIGPPEMAVGLLKTAMEKKSGEEGVTGFLIDGFPRRIEQAKLFETTICPPAAVLFLDCAEEVQRERLLNRAKTSGRTDDNESTIPKRFKTFTEATMPVIEYSRALDRVIQIDASKKAEEVNSDIQNQMSKILSSFPRRPKRLSETPG